LAGHVRGDSTSGPIFCAILLATDIHNGKRALKFEKLGGPVHGKWLILTIALENNFA